jgi:2-C-methyl-D-erythritol 2,4-cyclodiphosphate synthase
MAIRVGVGFDVHPFAAAGAGRPLVLAGVTFPGERGLVGHSDADVVAHAIADAILGAAGLGDLGLHFPDSDATWRGADSTRLLAETVRLAGRDGWRVGNIDCSVVLEAPRLAPHRVAMQERLAAIVGAPVSVKAKRAEGLGALGRREGIACYAVVLLESAVEDLGKGAPPGAA